MIYDNSDRERQEASCLGEFLTSSVPAAGARTAELRALTWGHVDVTGIPDDDPAVAPHVGAWRSVGAGADTIDLPLTWRGGECRRVSQVVRCLSECCRSVRVLDTLDGC